MNGFFKLPIMQAPWRSGSAATAQAASSSAAPVPLGPHEPPQGPAQRVPPQYSAAMAPQLAQQVEQFSGGFTWVDIMGGTHTFRYVS